MFFSRTLQVAALGPLALMAACTTMPAGPSAMALPGTGKNFDQFRADDAECRAYAQNQIGGTTAQDAAVDSGVRSAVVGAAVGALAGAAMGGHQGAGVGAGTGLIVGSMAGSGTAQTSAYGAQQRYDSAYIQCMYAKGEKVPVSGQVGSRTMRPQYAPAPNYAPPPPPGYVESPPSNYGPPPPPPAYTPPPSTQQPQAPAQATAGTWYYCDSAKAYYPYVANCPGAWRAVPATPNPPPR